MTAGELPLGLDRVGPGPVEAAMSRAIAAAVEAGELTDVHAAAAELGRTLAAGVDQAAHRGNIAGRAACSAELRKVLASLGLDRASRGELTDRKAGAGDPFDELSRAMSAATGDPSET